MLLFPQKISRNVRFPDLFGVTNSSEVICLDLVEFKVKYGFFHGLYSTDTFFTNVNATCCDTTVRKRHFLYMCLLIIILD